MKHFIEILQKNGGAMFGRYKANPDLCLAKGYKNAIFFSAIDVDFKGLLEIDGEDINLVNTTCYQISLKEAEILLTINNKDSGEFTVGMANLGFLDRIDLDEVLKGLNITRAK